MKQFEHVNAASFEEAGRILKESGGTAQAMAGGSDLLGTYKDNLLKTYPETVVNLKKIPGFAALEEEDGCLKVGAGCKLNTIAQNQAVQEACPALAEAAYSVASPLIRSIGTIGGNICQDVRCWYYRYPDSMGGALDCKRKGGGTCYAINGENRYHSVFGGMSCHGTPCAKSCPAGTDVPAYMAKLREGKWGEAAEIIMRYNPMPMMTSRICPHPCQDDCNQCTYGDSVNVHGVERSLGDYILEHADRYYCAPERETGKRAAIIGAGPGGLSAAYYLRKAGHSVVVYDRMEKAGGVLRYGIPHYRLPKDMVDAYVNALSAMGVKFRLGVQVGQDITVEEIQQSSDSMYVGTGAWKQPVLGLEGENLTQFGLDFLTQVNIYLEKSIGNKVLVCGGGNVAMDVALTAVRLGAGQVKLVCLEQEHDMPAASEEIARAREEGVEICNGWGLGRIVTDENGRVAGLEAKRCLAVFDEEHRFSPVYDEADRIVLEADTIILATGQRVDLSFLGEHFGGQLKSARGLIDADTESFKTKKDGVYAGGDAVTGPDIAIRAILAGRVAAAGMNRDLGGCGECGCEKADCEEIGRENPSADGNPQEAAFLRFDPGAVENAESHKLKEIPVSERTLIKEDASSFDRETAMAEAGRCMNCGCYAVSPSDISPVLVMAGADIVTTERTLTAEELFTKKLTVQDILTPGELVKEIRVPKRSGQMHYDKKRVRNAIDFAIVSLASCLDVKDNVIQDARLVFGGVAPVPLRVKHVEEFLKGKAVTEETADQAAGLAVGGASPMGKNEYKLFMMKDLMRSAVLRAGRSS
ncbi:FAD binding domain-containing protein [Enterocloster asparagiformis]|uniref:FAD binding domain-containing protein n=1 Tax=Enterocloster asparagiformis TaxID=333367 RepID=UPI000467E27A|nr:FAD binding domain-containing protein [Enterocloster asparagiformis]